MKKPEIVNQIVIKPLWKKDAPMYSERALTVQVYTEKAKAWIEREAPQFGKLSEPFGLMAVKLMAQWAKSEAPEKAEEIDKHVAAAKNGSGWLGIWDFTISDAYKPQDVIDYLIGGFNESVVGGEWVVGDEEQS